MAAKGILAMLGAPEPDSDDEGDELTPEARAVREMFDAHDKGDHAAAGRAFKRAYRICAANKGADSGSVGGEAEESGDEAEYEED